jgi:type III restriction enzyme
VRLGNGKTLVLETKGQNSRQFEAKRAALAEWIEAVNALADGSAVKEYGER